MPQPSVSEAKVLPFRVINGQHPEVEAGQMVGQRIAEVLTGLTSFYYVQKELGSTELSFYSFWCIFIGFLNPKLQHTADIWSRTFQAQWRQQAPPRLPPCSNQRLFYTGKYELQFQLTVC